MKQTTYKTTWLLVVLALALGIVSLVFPGSAFAQEDDDEPVTGKAEISESRALGIADSAYTGSGRFTDIELEMEHGTLVYAVEYTESDGNEVDVKVNAKTGAVVLIESDKDEPVDDDEGDDEDDDENRVERMETLINLLNQLIALLRAQAALR